MNQVFRKKSYTHNSLFVIHNSIRGFTLIELLIVVIIIGLLSSLVTSNLLGVRARGRDAQRKSDLRQLQSALELYRADQTIYPAAVDPGNCTTPGSFSSGGTIYMQKIPCDPLGTGVYNGGKYYYFSNGSTYTLGACIENASDATPGVTATNPGGSGTCSSARYFVLNNP